MEQKRSPMLVWGPIIGFVLLIAVLMAANDFLQSGMVTAENAQKEAAAKAANALTTTVAAGSGAAAASPGGSMPAAATEAAAPAATMAAAAPAATTAAAAPAATMAAAAPAATTAAAAPAATMAAAAPAATDAVTTTAATTAATEAAAAAAPAAVDVNAVAAIITKAGCGACHVIPGVPAAVGVVGPNLSDIGEAAATRKPGQTAQQYIHESIVNPNAFVAPKCPFGPCVGGAMPQNFSQTLTAQEIDTVVNYLLTMKTPVQ